MIDSPISEAGITGAGVGAALIGSRPVVELQISDFVTLTMDQLVNHAAKWRYMSGGQVSRAARAPRADLERHRDGRAALADARGVVRAHAGPRRADAVDRRTTRRAC